MTINSTNAGERVKLRIGLLEEAAKGQFENLECPDRRKPGASVWFTNPRSRRIPDLASLLPLRLSFARDQRGKSPYFTEDRRRKDLEERDKAVLSRMVFKKQQE